jgi:hypothetical protein
MRSDQDARSERKVVRVGLLPEAAVGEALRRKAVLRISVGLGAPGAARPWARQVRERQVTRSGQEAQDDDGRLRRRTCSTRSALTGTSTVVLIPVKLFCSVLERRTSTALRSRVRTSACPPHTVAAV